VFYLNFLIYFESRTAAQGVRAALRAAKWRADGGALLPPEHARQNAVSDGAQITAAHYVFTAHSNLRIARRFFHRLLEML
jgi:hypothetical protein